MKVIINIKEGRVSNVLAILFLCSLCAFVIWWGLYRDQVVLFIAPVFCVAQLFVCYILIGNLRHPKTRTLAIDQNRLVWTLRHEKSKHVYETSLPIHSIVTLEFVLPRTRGEVNTRDYSLAELYLLDGHGNRHHFPQDLFPGVYRKKIVAAIKREVPGVQVVEKMDEAG